VLYTGAGIGTLVGPPLAGAAFDAFGSYSAPILAGAALSFVAVGFVLALIRRTRAVAAA
jgi:cyanate permease